MALWTITYPTDEGERRYDMDGPPTALAAKTEFLRQMLLEKSDREGNLLGVGEFPMPQGVEFPSGPDTAKKLETAKAIWPKVAVVPRKVEDGFPQQLIEVAKQLHEQAMAAGVSHDRTAPPAVPATTRRQPH